jgi:TetR/AcrR family transcriptional regulator, cholesterol catabolism regulator
MNALKTTPQLLLDYGLEIVAKKGLRGLTVREVATGAGVNLGSFVYHFKTRERFVEELVELWYAPMYQELQITAANEAQHNAVKKLSATLSQLIVFINQNAGFIGHLLADALAGERTAQTFLLKLPERHPKLLLELIASAQLEGSIIQAPPVQLLMFIMASVGIPMLLVGDLVQGMSWLPPEADQLKQLMRDPQVAQLRLQWALRGIATLDSVPL